jgi:hypothetical protein
MHNTLKLSPIVILVISREKGIEKVRERERSIGGVGNSGPEAQLG